MTRVRAVHEDDAAWLRMARAPLAKLDGRTGEPVGIWNATSLGVMMRRAFLAQGYRGPHGETAQSERPRSS